MFVTHLRWAVEVPPRPDTPRRDVDHRPVGKRVVGILVVLFAEGSHCCRVERVIRGETACRPPNLSLPGVTTRPWSGRRSARRAGSPGYHGSAVRRSATQSVVSRRWVSQCRTRKTFHHWGQSTADEDEQRFTAKLDRVADNENQVQLAEAESVWRNAAIDGDSNDVRQACRSSSRVG